MSAEERAEERATMELKLKIETLALEHEKFIYTRAVGFPDRLGSAFVQAGSALLIGIGTTILWSLSTYKTLIEIVTKEVINRSILLLSCGFILAVMAFCIGLTVSIVQGDPMKVDRKQGRLIIAFGVTGLAGFSAFGLALYLLLRQLT